MALLLIFLFAFAIACWVFAGMQGRNGGVWFVLGLIFGPFALIAIAALPPVSPR